jgi:hypothetical protein
MAVAASGRDLQQPADEFLGYHGRQLLVLREFWTSCYGFLATDSGPLSVVPGSGIRRSTVAHQNKGASFAFDCAMSIKPFSVGGHFMAYLRGEFVERLVPHSDYSEFRNKGGVFASRWFGGFPDRLAVV